MPRKGRHAVLTKEGIQCSGIVNWESLLEKYQMQKYVCSFAERNFFQAVILKSLQQITCNLCLENLVL